MSGTVAPSARSPALTCEPLKVALDLSAITLDVTAHQKPQTDTVDHVLDAWDHDSPQACLVRRPRRDSSACGPSATRATADVGWRPSHANIQRPLDDVAMTLFSHFEADAFRSELPAWLAEVDSAVTAMAANRITGHHHHCNTDGQPIEDDMVTILELQHADDHTGVLRRPRIAVGCADGTVWLFGPHQTTIEEHQHAVQTQDHASRSPSSSHAMSRRTSVGSSRPISPPALTTTTESHSSRHPLTRVLDSTSNHDSTASHRPDGLVSRNSTTSLATRRSTSGASFADLSPAAGTSRPRKASATVSISGPVISVDDPDQTTQSSSSRPLSPSFSIATSPTSPTHPQPLFKVQSPSPPASRHARGHTKAKDSIASGIGLWETDSHIDLASQAGSSRDIPTNNPKCPSGGVSEDDAIVNWKQIRSVKPIVRVRTCGSGQIVSLTVVEAGKWCPDELQGLLCLKNDGALSLHSWTDGRCLASCDAAAAVPTSSRSGPVTFQGCKVLQMLDSNIALCYGPYGTGFVAVDLDTFTAQKGLPGGVVQDGIAVMFKQGMHFLACVGPTPAEGAAAELLIRPSFVREGASSIGNGSARQPKLYLEEPHSAGQFEGMSGAQILGLRECADDLVAFSRKKIALYTVKEQSLHLLGSLAVDDIQEVHVAGYNRVTITTGDSLRLYKIIPAVSDDKSGQFFLFKLVSNRPLSPTEKTLLLPGGIPEHDTCMVIVKKEHRARSLSIVTVRGEVDADESYPEPLEQCTLLSVEQAAQKSHRATCSCTLPDGSLAIGYTSGVVRHTSLGSLHLPSPASSELVGQHSAAVSVIEIVRTASASFVLVGAIDGSASAWKMPGWTPVGQWQLFASPVSHIVVLDQQPLDQQPLTVDANTASIAVISANSPVALLNIKDKVRVSYVLPGTRSPVESISTNSLRSEIVVVYAQGLARTCSLDGQELRRSMDYRTARAVLSEPGWTTWFTLRDRTFKLEPPSTLKNPWLYVDVRPVLDGALSSFNETDKRQTESDVKRRAPNNNTTATRPNLGTVRALLAHLHTWSVDEELDDIFVTGLRIDYPEQTLPFVLSSPAGCSAILPERPADVWTISQVGSAQLLLRLVCLLRVLLDDTKTEKHASRAIAFYHAQIGVVVGDEFAAPSIRTLASYWLDQSAEVSQAARTLFGSYLASFSVATVSDMVKHFAHLLPSRRPAHELSAEVDEALLLIGLIATERYSIMTVDTLKDVASSILLYLDDASSPHRQAIATELCSRDFQTWQHYVDPTALVRQLFGLATGRLGTTPLELRNMARLAVVNLASINSSLFMTTMLHDIVSSPSPTHRNATLKLLLFMMRKRPLTLFSSLPRVADAVVKSLDPTVSDVREAVHQAATVILGELVKTYPSIDFHHKSQRLAVGTHEGSTIVYDLRTATPLYVLEAHKSPVTALSWSPDGHRLISVSLDETKVVVWKVGQGILSMFMPGAPPRQGIGLRDNGSAPYKTFSFHVGDEAATLEWVVLDWPGDRTARLRIRETSINFGV
ncbi:hypothetical protein OIV83_005887 [Microbotryomycetes sp. JL201]|nr:hypothetical protein OIV83_005887 [Microbotryomycetes sp. JL201]